MDGSPANAALAAPLDPGRLLSVIELQNEIAATDLDLEQIMALVCARASTLADADAAVLEMAEGDEMVYRAASGTAAGHIGLRLSIDASLSGQCVRTGEVLRCDDAEQDARVDVEACRKVGAMSLICVPLHHRGEVVGALKVYSAHVHAFVEGDAELLGHLSGIVASHMQHARQFELSAHQSRHDGLTGLANRRAYDERLRAEVARAQRAGGSLCVVLFDLDGFKSVNDRLGHPAGDTVLRRVSELIRGTRGSDQSFRIGGDEFALLLPNTPAPGATHVAERVAKRVLDAQVDDGRVRVSYGIAQLTVDDSAQALHARADAALLGAKRARPHRRSR